MTVPVPPERPEDVIARAFSHPEPYKEGDPRCPGCKAEAALAALVAERDAAERKAQLWQDGTIVERIRVKEAEAALADAVAARDEARRERDALKEEQAVYYAQANRIVAEEARLRQAAENAAAWAQRLLSAKLAAEASRDVAADALKQIEALDPELTRDGYTRDVLARYADEVLDIACAALVELNPDSEGGEPVPPGYSNIPGSVTPTAAPTVTPGNTGSDLSPGAVELNPDGLSEPRDTNSGTGDNPRGESHAGTRQPDSLNGPGGTLNPASDPESLASLSPSSEVAAPAMSDRCKCGHQRRAHHPIGCFANGCECKGFLPLAAEAAPERLPTPEEVRGILRPDRWCERVPCVYPDCSCAAEAAPEREGETG